MTYLLSGQRYLQLVEQRTLELLYGCVCGEGGLCANLWRQDTHPPALMVRMYVGEQGGNNIKEHTSCKNHRRQVKGLRCLDDTLPTRESCSPVSKISTQILTHCVFSRHHSII